MATELIRAVLGWCVVINFGILLIWFVFFTLGRTVFEKWHARLFSIPADQLGAIHYRGMMYYKIAIIVFNLAPYLALLIVSCHYVG